MNADCARCTHFIYNADEDFHVCREDMTNEQGECEMFWDRADAEAEGKEIEREIRDERNREVIDETHRECSIEA